MKSVIVVLAFIQASLCTISNVHLALTGNPDQMVVSWLTDVNSNSVVKYGTNSGNLNLQAQGYSNTYHKTAGYNHNVVLSNLAPNTRYYYICGDGQNWSSESSFLTQATDPVPFTIAVYGDMGIWNSENTMKRIIDRTQNGEFAFVMHLGDISYADDHLEYEPTWNEWFSDMAPVLSSIPYMAAPGNHEYSCRKYIQRCYDYTQNFTSFVHKFRMPGNESGSNTNLWYSFDYGNVHFVAINTECCYPNSPYGGDEVTQLEWLKKDLQKANQNRQNVPWIFVYAHRAMYSAGSGHHIGNTPIEEDYHVQAAFEEIFYENQVDIFFAGHVHLYERQYATYQDNPVSFNYNYPNATVHIVSGGAGNIEGLNHFGHPLPTWHAFGYDSDQGYGILTVHNDTHLSWEFRSSTTDQIQDSMVLIQSRS